MIFWTGRSERNLSALVAYFKLDAIAKIRDVSFSERRKKARSENEFIHKELFTTIFRYKVFFVQHSASVFKDRIVFIDFLPYERLNDVLFVSRDDVFSGKKLPEHVALNFDDIEVIRKLYYDGKKISWVVQDLRKSASFLFMYEFENLIINPFETVLIHPDGTTTFYKSFEDFFIPWKENLGKIGLFKDEKNSRKKGFSKSWIMENILFDSYYYKFKRKMGYKKVRISSYIKIAWYNITSIYYGIYKFNSDIHGRAIPSPRRSKQK